MISYGRQYIDKDDIDAVVATLQGDFLTTGPKIEEFEKSLCDHTGAKYAVVCGNGTQALHLAYMALGIGLGDEVIIPANTFVATANMVIACGGVPVFCDIDPNTYNIDVHQIENHITDKTKAIVPVHFAGQPCEMDKIWSLAEKYNIHVVEDAAHALGSAYHGDKIGAGESDCCTFSFHPVKPITTCEGGAILTDNEALYLRMKTLRTHGIERSERGFNDMTMLGYNYRITDIQCALGISQMKKIDAFLHRRNEIANLYTQLLKDLSEVQTPILIDDIYSGWHLYVVTFTTKEMRDTILKKLRDNGYRVTLHYPPVHINTYYQENGYADSSMPIAESYFERCLSLPIFYGLTNKDVKMVCDVISREL